MMLNSTSSVANEGEKSGAKEPENFNYDVSIEPVQNREYECIKVDYETNPLEVLVTVGNYTQSYLKKYFKEVRRCYDGCLVGFVFTYNGKTNSMGWNCYAESEASSGSFSSSNEITSSDILSMTIQNFYDMYLTTPMPYELGDCNANGTIQVTQANKRGDLVINITEGKNAYTAVYLARQAKTTTLETALINSPACNN